MGRKPRCEIGKVQTEVLQYLLALEPGTPVPSYAALAKMFGRDWRTMRRFIKELSGNGVLLYDDDGRRFPSSGLGLAKQTDRLVTMDFRMNFEPIAAARAAIECKNNPKGRAARKLDFAYRNMQKANDRGDVNGEADADIKFHTAISEFWDNPLARHCFALIRCAMAKNVKDFVTRLYSEHGYPDDTCNEHYDIYEAIKDGDDQAAARAMRKHLSNAYARMKIALANDAATDLPSQRHAKRA